MLSKRQASSKGSNPGRPEPTKRFRTTDPAAAQVVSANSSSVAVALFHHGSNDDDDDHHENDFVVSPSAITSTSILLPPDLFDLKQAVDHVMDKSRWNIHSAAAQQALEALEYKARESAFYYGGDEDLYGLALDVYNRDGGGGVARILRLPLQDATCYHGLRLPKRCSDCRRSLETTEHATHCIAVYDRFGKQEVSSYRCLGCVGCQLALEYGTDRAALESRRSAANRLPPPRDKEDTTKPTVKPDETTQGWSTALSARPHWREDCPMATFTPSCAHVTCAKCQCYVCNGPAAECQHWSTTTTADDQHCRAIHGPQKWDLLHEQNTPDNITMDPSLFDFLSLPVSWDPDEKAQRQERARDTQYTYDDDHAMMLALELYNRTLCTMEQQTNRNILHFVTKKYPNIPKENIYDWQVRDDYGIYTRSAIRGVHRTPCTQCGCSFNDAGQKVYFERSTYGLSYEKVCDGCMGRNLCARFGSRKATILHQLEECRAQQAQRIQTKDSYFYCDQNLHVSNYCRYTDMIAVRKTTY